MNGLFNSRSFNSKKDARIGLLIQVCCVLCSKAGEDKEHVFFFSIAALAVMWDFLMQTLRTTSWVFDVKVKNNLIQLFGGHRLIRIWINLIKALGCMGKKSKIA